MWTTSTPRFAPSILFVLLAACGGAEAKTPAARSSRVTEPVATAPAPSAPAASALPVAPAPPPRATPDGPPSPATLSLVSATFTHGVESRRPVDEVQTFAVGERATVHLVVKNLGAPREVTVEWVRGETVLGRTALEVGTSPSWRTWATRRVTARDVASGVHARVLDPDGTLLEELDADVSAPPIEPAV